MVVAVVVLLFVAGRSGQALPAFQSGDGFDSTNYTYVGIHTPIAACAA